MTEDMDARLNAREKFRLFRVLILLAAVLSLAGVLVLALVRADELVMGPAAVEGNEQYDFRGPMDGKIAAVLKDEGDKVKAGEPLLTLDDRAVRDEILKAENQIAELKAEADAKRETLATIEADPLPARYRDAEVRLKREIRACAKSEEKLKTFKQLCQERVISKIELNQVELDHERNLAELASLRKDYEVAKNGMAEKILSQARAEIVLLETRRESKLKELESLKSKRAEYIIRAPEDGVVVDMPVKPGVFAAKGEIIVRLATTGHKKIVVYVDESRVHKVKLGQTVRIISNCYNYLDYGYFTGKVREVAELPVRRDGVYCFPVEAEVTEEPYRLKLGSTAKAMIITGKERILSSLLGFGGR